MRSSSVRGSLVHRKVERSARFRVLVVGVVLSLVASFAAVGLPVVGLMTPAFAEPPLPVASGSATTIQHGVVGSPHGTWWAVAINRTSPALSFLISAGGTSWQTVAAPPSAATLQSFTINDSGTLFAVTKEAGYPGWIDWWKNSGAGWVAMAAPSPERVGELLTDGSYLVAITLPDAFGVSGRLWKSANEGGSWSGGQQASGFDPYWDQTFLVGGIVHAAIAKSNGQLQYKRWDVATATALPVDAPPNGPADQWQPHIFAAPGSTSTFYIAAISSSGGLYIYKTANSGGVWVTMVANDLPPVEFAGATTGSCAGVCSVYSFAMGSDGRIHMYGGTYASGNSTLIEVSHGTDNVGDWSPVTTVATVPGDNTGFYTWPTQRVDGVIAQGTNVWASVAHGTNTSDFYRFSAAAGSVVTPPATTSFNTTGSVVKTGLSTLMALGPSNVAVSPSRAWQAALVTDAATSVQTILRSQDGTHWSTIPRPVTSSIFAIGVADTGEVYAVVKTTPTGYYSSTDFYRYRSGRWYGHVTYAQFSPSFDSRPAAIIRAGNDLIGIEQPTGRISYSTDDGNTWLTYTNGLGINYSSDCGTTIVAEVVHALCRGNTAQWTYRRWSRTTRAPLTVTTPPGVPTGATAKLLPLRDHAGEIWIGDLTSGTGLVGLARSTDNGATWTTVDAGSALPTGFLSPGYGASLGGLGGDDRLYIFGCCTLRRIDRALAAAPSWSPVTTVDSQLAGASFVVTPTAAAEPVPPDVWLLRKTSGTGVAACEGTGTCELRHYGALGGPVPILDSQTYGPPSTPSLFAMRPESAMADPVNSATGSYTDQVADAALPAIGVPLAMTRTYNSADATVGVLGRGWTFSYAVTLTTAWDGVTLRAGDGQQVTYTLNGDGSYSGPPGGLSTLVKNGNGGYTISSKHQDHYEFDSAGRLSEITDRNSQGVSLAYDGSGRLSTASASGRTITLGYNGSGLLVTATLSDGRWVGYGYTSGRLTDVRDLRGYHTTYSYDAGGRLASIQDANGHYVIRNTYDPTTGRVTDQYDPRGNHTSFTWDAYTQTATMTAPDGGVWQDVYNGNVLTKQINPLGQATTFAYDVNLDLVAVTDAAGNTTQCAYDERGNLIQEATPDGATYDYTYDNLNNQTGSTTPRGTTTTVGYDAKGNPVSTARPNPAGGNPITTSLTRDATTGLVTAATDARGKTTGYTYNTNGDLTSQTSPLGETATWGYDSAGRITSLVGPRGNAAGTNPDNYRTSITYDEANNVLSVTDPLANATTFTYDPVGNRASHTDAKNRTTTYAYDEANHLVQIAPPTPIGPTTYTYTVNGQLATITQPGNRVNSFTYDTAGRLTTATNPIGTMQFGYEATGNRTTSTDPSGNTVSIGYDQMHRVTSLTYPSGTPNVTYTYDADGNRTTMTDGAGTVSYTYDTLDRLTSVARGTDAFTYTYDVAGNLTTRTFPGQPTETFGYDDDGRTISLARGTTTLASYTYDPDSHLTHADLGNGIVQIRTWDPDGRLTDISHTRNNTVQAEAAYAYDPTGNPTSIVDAAGTINSYTYDTLDRLTGACFNSADCATATDYIRWTYDDLGHRLTETRPAGTTTYTYNTKDQLTQASGPAGNTSYLSDTKGNQTQAGATTASYNAAGRVSSQTTAGVTTTYSYDGDGRRLTATAAGAGTQFLWDPVSYQLAVERDNTGSSLRSYSYGLGLTAMTTPGIGGTTYYYLPDGQGSTPALTDAAGATQWQYQWEPYGANKNTTQADPNAPTNPRGWLGEYADPSQYHLRARQYDPATGQFTSPDQGGSGDTYGYAGANPLVNTDPLGLDSSEDTIRSVNEISAQTAMYTGTAALVCSATVICAPLDAVLGPIALGAGLIAAGTGIGLAINECNSPKGTCSLAVINASLQTAAIVPGMGSLGKLGQEAIAAERMAGLGEGTGQGLKAIGGSFVYNEPSQLHHVFPQQFRTYFERAGLDIDEAAVELPGSIHGGLHSAQWNAVWEEFILQNPNASSKEIIDQASNMINQYGLDKYIISVQRYK